MECLDGTILEGELGSVTVSIIIPVYNERAYIEEVLVRVQATDLEKEVLVIDDGSSDGTRDLLRDLEKAQADGRSEVPVQNGRTCLPLQNIRFIFQDRNCGKGAALRRGFEMAEGEMITWRDGFTTLWCILRYNLFD